MTIQDTRKRLLVTVVVMSAAIMQILDTTIVTVALPHMRGALGANANEITWVLTSYLISSGIFMPLTGYLTDRIGQKTYLIWSIVGFTVASVLCGLATSLQEIVLFRLLQGVAGAGLVPTAQAVLVDAYPARERGHAMAIFGVGAMFGPIIGPTLGGYLTQVFDWRWTFFINVPVGALALFGAWRFIAETEKRPRNADWLGFSFLVIAVACMQYVLDRGQEHGWFGSHLIQVMAISSLFGFVCLILRNREMGHDAVFDLAVFKDRNFSVSALILATFMFSMYGVLALQPMMLESLYGYPAFTTGLVLAPRGLASMASMFLAGRLINRVGAKPLMFAGILIALLGTLITTHYSLDISPWWVVWPVAVQGFGLGLVFVPLATVTFATLPARLSAEAAGIRQLARAIGASLGVALSSAIVVSESAATWNTLGGHWNAFSAPVAGFLRTLGLHAGQPTASAVLSHLLGRQAQFQGLLDGFYVLGWSLILGVPLLLLIGKGVGKQPSGVPGAGTGLGRAPADDGGAGGLNSQAAWRADPT